MCRQWASDCFLSLLCQLQVRDFNTMLIKFTWWLQRTISCNRGSCNRCRCSDKSRGTDKNRLPWPGLQHECRQLWWYEHTHIWLHDVCPCDWFQTALQSVCLLSLLFLQGVIKQTFQKVLGPLRCLFRPGLGTRSKVWLRHAAAGLARQLLIKGNGLPFNKLPPVQMHACNRQLSQHMQC